jgi:hypothetical protein
MNVSFSNESFFNSTFMHPSDTTQGSGIPLLPIFIGCMFALGLAVGVGRKVHRSYFAPTTCHTLRSDPNCRFSSLPSEIRRMIFVPGIPLDALDEDNQTWVSVAQALGWSDISAQVVRGGQTFARGDGEVKREVMQRIDSLLGSIRGIAETEKVPPDILSVMQRPMTVESFKYLHRWKRARDTLKVWENLAHHTWKPKPTSWGNGQRMIDEAEGVGAFAGGGFSRWFSTHQTDLTRDITDLFLIGSSLSSLPSELFTLVNLTKMNLFNNDLDEIPSDITKLTQLNTLLLTENRLTTLPNGIGTIPSLTKLGLKGNPLVSLPAELSSFTGTLLLDRHLSINALIKT